MTCDKKCKRNIRVNLAVFAAINYMLGMGTFMFFLCSNSPSHMKQLNNFLVNPIGFVTGDTEVDHSHHAHH
jgi:hypothetical protein